MNKPSRKRKKEMSLTPLDRYILRNGRDQHNGWWLFPTLDDIANSDAVGVGEMLFDPFLPEESGNQCMSHVGFAAKVPIFANGFSKFMPILLCIFGYFLNNTAQADVPKALTPKQFEAERKAGFKGEYFLTRSEDPVCIPFTKNLNQFRTLDFDECAPRLSENFPEFSRPEWKEVPLDLEIAEKAFKDLSLEYESSKVEMERKWQHWLQETAELRASGQVKMWLTEADINNDGFPDPIARVQYAHPASSLPVKQRGCLYSHSGLRYLSSSPASFFGPFKHFYFSRDADIIYSNKTEQYYSVEWSEGQVGPILQGQEIGASRGVLVKLSRTAASSPIPVCYINWVPTGSYRPLQHKSTPAKHSN